MTRRIGLAVAVLGLVAGAAGQARAVFVLDMEGVAQVNGFTNESSSAPRTVNGFTLTMDHGHFIDAGYATLSGYSTNNGTDWLMADTTTGFAIQASGGGAFSAQSFDVGEFFSPPGTQLTVTGTLLDGHTISQSFTTDLNANFQTLALGSGFTNLTRLFFLNPGGALAFDNISLNGPASVSTPEPATFAPAVLGVLMGLGYAWRRRRAA